MTDGGEGTVSALVTATHSKKICLVVQSPLNELVNASYGISIDGKQAFIKMAEASGLELLDPKIRNLFLATTFGTGGSATNDGGAGMLQALSASLLDSNGDELWYGDSELLRLFHIDFTALDPRCYQCEIDVVCDVVNPLTGQNEASPIFGTQKGTTPKIVSLLDKALINYSSVIKNIFGYDLSNYPGTCAGWADRYGI